MSRQAPLCRITSAAIFAGSASAADPQADAFKIRNWKAVRGRTRLNGAVVAFDRGGGELPR